MVSFERIVSGDVPVAVIGLGYVGLPLAISLAKHFSVIGYDQHAQRIDELRRGHDHTGEVSLEALRESTAYFTADPQLLEKAGVLIIAVPTPIDAHHTPDLIPLLMATRTVASFMQRGSVVVYESTVWPGATEEKCVPVLENVSGMRFGRDFTVGYSPERINPGDKVHTLENVTKIVAGSDDMTTGLLAELYGTILSAGVHVTSSIMVAEAAKVIENTQRDLNIALMNELAIIFNSLGIDTGEVLKAAGTKWNFLPFTPGLVGGHCIGVDPYYLTFKAESLGYHPQVILAGRRINDSMGKFVAESCVKELIRKGVSVRDAKVGILGFTYKENVPDIRNTRVIDIVRELKEYGIEALVHDPIADNEQAIREYEISLSHLKHFQELDALIVAVPHEEYSFIQPKQLTKWFRNAESALVLDVKGFFEPVVMEAAGLELWRM
ncbi:nucleotide sugar dehydrogenase [Halodesulfovibrio sp.]|jgi:UDP-N-acetyl-D-galactosamine dehydrogenase|uniref:nucleotide sugar dehydrogenase n=1 Tax=Halodesulfovibrio sp. TaxID=1912772 RepID=UPI0025D67F90|nr:nucleotide sugar dehydrogenase [Halodesulfovibrio sp.]MCT4533968.1 nucleotide sugar dehydrogenase [Halodesulfovibrio sp.]